MRVHQRSSAFYSRVARGNCWNLHLALESSASPRREGERIEVRGFVSLQIHLQNPLPTISLGKGEANTCKAAVARCRDILGEERARKLAN
jgi:hypothetical protein